MNRINRISPSWNGKAGTAVVGRTSRTAIAAGPRVEQRLEAQASRGPVELLSEAWNALMRKIFGNLNQLT